MSYYWAKFKQISNNTFRFDTRIYLNLTSDPSDNDLCIGAIVGKNPGSAIPSSSNNTSLQKIVLDGDNLLPTVRSIFTKAYQHSEKPIQKNSYIQVLNLLYICDKELSQAIRKIGDYPNPIICDTESRHFPFVWYVWGGKKKGLNFYKERFNGLNANLHFYLNTQTNEIVDYSPRPGDSARHTQGLKHELVVPYISSII